MGVQQGESGMMSPSVWSRVHTDTWGLTSVSPVHSGNPFAEKQEDQGRAL